MFKKWMITLLLLAAPALQAGDSGLYWNPLQQGLALTLVRDKDLVFTQIMDAMHKDVDCYEFDLPNQSLADNTSCSPPLTFWAADPISADGQSVQGFLYTPVGLNQPQGIQSQQNPFATIHTEMLVVGVYRMERLNNTAGGWILSVTRIGNVLPSNTPIYGVTVYPNRLVIADEAKD